MQGISPRRWLLGTFSSLAVIAAVAAVPCGLAFGWWFRLAQWQGLYPGYPWYWEHFELTPLSMACWTLLAMALPLVTGVVVRRTVPAMAAFVLTYGAWLFFADPWLRPHLFTIGTVVKPVSWLWGNLWGVLPAVICGRVVLVSGPVAGVNWSRCCYVPGIATAVL